MKEAVRQYRWVFTAVFLLFTLSGCFSAALTDKLRWADDKAGEMFNEFGVATSTPDTGTSSLIQLPDIDLAGLKDKAIDLKDRLLGRTGTSTADTATSTFDREKLDMVITDAKGLTLEAKTAIDQWLAENGYNRYGDPIGTYYTGGTPLFNEMTGEARDRFEYVLEKQPDILRIINN